MIKKNLAYLVFALLVVSNFSACKSEEKPEETSVVNTSKVTNAVVVTTSTTTTTEYVPVTAAKTTASVDIPQYTPEDPTDSIKVEYQEEKKSFAMYAADNVSLNTTWFTGKNQVSICDMNLDGYPEMLVLDYSKEIPNEYYYVYECKVYDLKTLKSWGTFEDTEDSMLTFYKEPVELWLINIENEHKWFTDNSVETVLAVDYSGTKPIYYIKGVETDRDSYIAEVSALSDYTKDYNKKPVVCKEVITEDNIDNCYSLITDAIARWSMLNAIPSADYFE